MKTLFRCALFSLLAILASPRPALADGQLDATFVNPNVFCGSQFMVQESDGRLTAVGCDTVLRLLPNGEDDPSFARATCNSLVQSFARHADGKLVVGGNFFEVNRTGRGQGIARLNADGSLDNSFNPQAAGVSSGLPVTSVLAEDDGGVVAGRFHAGGSDRAMLVVRWKTDGTLDATFIAPPINGSVSAMARQLDGKILIGGDFTRVGGLTRNRLARLNADGSHDTNFLSGGLTGFVNTISLGLVRKLLVLEDGDLLVGGRFNTVNGERRIHVARLNPDGSLDGAFTGFTTVVPNILVRALAVQHDGKIYIGGNFTTIDGQPRGGFARLNSNGSLDTTFANGLSRAIINDLILVGPDRLLVAGSVNEINGVPRRFAARVWTVPPPALPPQILVQPEGANVFQGASVNFLVQAVGTSPLGYRWEKNGRPVLVATANTFSIPTAQPSDSGTYRVVVTNEFGMDTSAEVVLAVAPALPLPESLDAPELTWTTSGAQSWIGQATVTHDGTDAARNGVIGDGEASILETTATGPATVTFWWKVSSEEDADFLSFFVDELQQGSGISGEADWRQRTILIPPGSHTLRWRYEKDSSVSDGQDAGSVDEVVVKAAPVIELPEALDAPQLAWKTSGDQPWLGQNLVSHDGIDAGRSGLLEDFGQSELEASVIGPGTLTFWWKVSSERSDRLTFFLDDSDQELEISGEVDWEQRTVAIPAGVHTLNWWYSKDSSVLEGEDAGWVDEAVFTSFAPVLKAPKLSGPDFTFAVQTETGKDYTVEFTEKLNPPEWKFLQTISGDGTLSPVAAPVLGIPQRFFRARQP
ncbi:MAG: immunoglobulin domain-containing protein [Verrucomicrobia bacterium]|nr:immunoglobulin domain-containing protein [Verrucomicrobiota bacterium]